MPGTAPFPRKCFKNVLGAKLEGTLECEARLENADLGDGCCLPSAVSESIVSSTGLSEFCLLSRSSPNKNSQPMICVPKQTHRVTHRTQRV